MLCSKKGEFPKEIEAFKTMKNFAMQYSDNGVDVDENDGENGGDDEAARCEYKAMLYQGSLTLSLWSDLLARRAVACGW